MLKVKLPKLEPVPTVFSKIPQKFRFWIVFAIVTVFFTVSVWFLQGEGVPVGSRLIMTFGVGVIVMLFLLAYKWLAPRLGKATSVVALTLLAAVAIFGLSLTAQACYTYTGQPRTCTVKEATQWASSVLLFPIVVVLLFGPLVWFVRRLVRLVFAFGKKPDSEQLKVKETASKAARSGNPAVRAQVADAGLAGKWSPGKPASKNVDKAVKSDKNSKNGGKGSV